MDYQYPTLQTFSPKPDINKFMDIVLGRNVHNHDVPMVEFIVDTPVIKEIVTTLFHRQWVDYGEDRESQKAYLDNLIEFWLHMGYDMMRYENSMIFPGIPRTTENTAAGTQNNRSWAEESVGAITSWEEFEKYKFPKVEEFDFFPFEYLNKHLPEGMGLALAHGGGIFERVSWIFSIEKLCYLLFDQPELIEAVTQKISDLQMAFYKHLLDLDRLSAIFPGDDMGFRSATLISPADLRKYFLPFHTQLSALSHQREVPYFLHSCGNLTRIIPDLIDDVKIDGKHSYEDTIIPFETFHEKYGSRLAVLGGMDVHFLATSSLQQIRDRVRSSVETCGSRGRFAIGSGNSVPDYVPVENYLALVDEALALRKY